MLRDFDPLRLLNIWLRDLREKENGDGRDSNCSTLSVNAEANICRQPEFPLCVLWQSPPLHVRCGPSLIFHHHLCIIAEDLNGILSGLHPCRTLSIPTGIWGNSLAAELIGKLTTFLRREEEKNPLQLHWLQPSGSLSGRIESTGSRRRRFSFPTHNKSGYLCSEGPRPSRRCSRGRRRTVCSWGCRPPGPGSHARWRDTGSPYCVSLEDRASKVQKTAMWCSWVDIINRDELDLTIE